QLNADDLPLGVTADMEFTHVRELTLEPGDTLVLLTDGFFEWQNPDGEQWGIDRLVESAARHRDADPNAMIAAILADAETFVDGAAQDDDLTMVVIRRSVH
ncbi:MAG: PP2C family protein-serine/threonine phosphatase, partial [Planctomycetota bacterium]